MQSMPVVSTMAAFAMIAIMKLTKNLIKNMLILKEKETNALDKTMFCELNNKHGKVQR